MDNDGLIDRKQKKVPAKELFEIAQSSKHFRQYLNDWFELDGKKVKIRNGQDKNDIEIRLFKTLGYDDKLKYCVRPEQLENIRKDTWNAINHHLGTNAKSLDELVEQLSMQRYGRLITVGDCFSGGGSIPFEAARIGARAFGSDLNPIAGLLTWANINILGANDDQIKDMKAFQEKTFQTVNTELSKIGIEHNENGDRALSYLYCVEANCPECGIKVPLAPSWLIGKGTKTVAILSKDGNGYDIGIKMGASSKEMQIASEGTITSKGLLCPNCGMTTPIPILRGDRVDSNGNMISGLRKWGKSDFDFLEEDIYNERLYAIKYETKDGQRFYRAPTNTT